MKLHSWARRARMPIQSKQHINQENFFVSPIGLIKIYRLKARNACALALATSPVGARHVHKSCIDSNQRCHSIPIFFPCPVSFKIDVTGETSRTFGRKKRPKIIYSICLLFRIGLSQTGIIISWKLIRRIRALANNSVTDSSGASFEASRAQPPFFGAIRLYTTGRFQTNSVVAIRLPNCHKRFVKIVKKKIALSMGSALRSSPTLAQTPAR